MIMSSSVELPRWWNCNASTLNETKSNLLCVGGCELS
jgi:hypothetical protein